MIHVVASDSPIKQKGNCTLIALRQLLPEGVSDQTILGAATMVGDFPFYGPGRGGMSWPRFWKTVAYLGLDACPLNGSWSMMTLAKFCKQYPQGDYIVGVNGHVLVVRDGVVVDPNFRKLTSRKTVHRVNSCLVTNAAPAPAPTLGRLRVVRNANEAKRKNTATHNRYYQMHNFLFAYPAATEAELFAGTAYTPADLAYDLAHGHVERI